MYKDVEKSEIAEEAKSLTKGEAASQALDSVAEFFDKNKKDTVDEEKQKRIKELADKNLENVINLEIERRTKATGTKPNAEQVRAEIIPQYSQSKNSFKTESAGEFAPFFRVVPIGNSTEYYINEDHNFFKNIWMNERANPFMRESMKLLIAAIGQGYIGAQGDSKRWYTYELTEWSKNLGYSSDHFVEKFNLNNKDKELE